MKNYFKLVMMIGSIFFVFSCTKDEPTSSFNNDSYYEKVIQSENHDGGIIKLSDDEYNALPRLDLSSLKPYPGFEFTSRASVKTLNTPPVQNQGREGSCAAFALGYCLGSYYNNLFLGIPYNNTGFFSPEYLYNNIKLNPGNCTVGVESPRVLNFMVNNGAPSWQLMPYSDANGCTQLFPAGFQPTTKTTTKKIFNVKLGKYVTVTETTTTYPPFPKYKIPSWRTVWAVWPLWIGNVIKDVINSGRPIVGVFEVESNFNSQTAISPYCYSSTSGSKTNNWHAVTIIGYDDTNKKFKIQNSWGTGRHDKGYFYVSYSNIGVFKELYTML